MSPRSARGQGSARLALVGVTTPEGASLRRALERLHVVGSRVDLFATEENEAVISEYAGEARLIQTPRIDEILDHDLVFLCERGALAREVARRRTRTPIIDLAMAIGGTPGPRLVHIGLNPDSIGDHDGLLAVPHPLAIVLSELIYPVHAALEILDAVAVLIRPAADFGERGVEELREQTVGLLTFSKVPVSTFGRQLAFNVIPQAHLNADLPGIEARVAAQVAEILRWDTNRLALRLLTAPLFYGHGVQIRFRVAGKASLADVRKAIKDAAVFDPPDVDGPSTPLEVATEYRSRLADLSEDGVGGFWMWAVAGETVARGAHEAIRLAEALCDL